MGFINAKDFELVRTNFSKRIAELVPDSAHGTVLIETTKEGAIYRVELSSNQNVAIATDIRHRDGSKFLDDAG